MNQSIARSRYLAGGALVYAFVSAVWLVITYFVGEVNGRLLLITAVPLLLILVMSALVSLRRPQKRQAAPQSEAELGKWFGIIFSAEGVAIGVSSGILAALGLAAWIPPAVALIVGLHFLPLGHLLQLPSDYLLGGAIILLVLLTVALAPTANWGMLVGLGTSALLWLAGWGRLWAARQT